MIDTIKLSKKINFIRESWKQTIAKTFVRLFLLDYYQLHITRGKFGTNQKWCFRFESLQSISMTLQIFFSLCAADFFFWPPKNKWVFFRTNFKSSRMAFHAKMVYKTSIALPFRLSGLHYRKFSVSQQNRKLKLSKFKSPDF